MNKPPEFEPEFSDDELVRQSHNTLVKVVAGIAGVSLAAAGVIVGRHIRAMIREAKELKQKEE